MNSWYGNRYVEEAEEEPTPDESAEELRLAAIAEEDSQIAARQTPPPAYPEFEPYRIEQADNG